MITILREERGENECFVLSDGKNSLAECVYSLDDSEILSLFSESCDEMLMESVLRAALSRLDNMGKNEVKTKITGLGGFFSKLGFQENNNVYTVNTSEFFKTCCNSN